MIHLSRNAPRRFTSQHWLNLAAAIWIVVMLNYPFWRAAWRATGGLPDGNPAFQASLPLAVLCFVWLTIELLTWGRLAKPMVVLLLVISAAASYFIGVYGVLIDKEMIANVAQTHVAEARELFDWRLLAWILAVGALPGALVTLVPTPRLGLRRLLLKGSLVAAIVLVLIVVVATFFKSYAGLIRNHRALRLQLVPTNVLSASYSYAKNRLSAPSVLTQVGLDAKARQRTAGAKPRLLVLMVGETARAPSFSITGYERETNPQMASDTDVLAFWDFSSCGTNTAVSLPCMFLDVGRDAFNGTLALTRESLLDVLQRAGLQVLWRDNNSGCKGVCDRVPREDVSSSLVEGLCNRGECWDERLLYGLQDRIQVPEQDTVLVLHMKGSHGPAYYLRYPPQFEHYTPVCKTSQLDQCERQSILNAYDNTVRYTDHVLAKAIDFLKANSQKFDTTMLYVSDHGESLGENGLYLHGMPYAIAPSEQTRIPMLAWMPREIAPAWGLDADCMRRQLNNTLTHDSLYHTVLGLMGVSTSAYRIGRDVFSVCRSALPATTLERKNP